MRLDGQFLVIIPYSLGLLPEYVIDLPLLHFQAHSFPGRGVTAKNHKKDVRFAVNLSKSVRFEFNATNAVKKKLLSGENIFSALKR